MTHDKFCEYHGETMFNTRPCTCDLIARIREDERQAEANRRAARFGVWHDYRPGLP